MKKQILLLLAALVIFSYFVHSIETFVIQETEKISLQTNASDPDFDKLTTAYNAPLNQNGEWQTNYGDAGEYKATITVSDGTSNVSKDILIKVKRKEEPPKIDSFSPKQDNLDIKETDSIMFKISASDLNNDNLHYHWFLDGKKVNDGEGFNYATAYNDSGSHKISAVVSDGKSNESKEWTVNVDDLDRPAVFEEIGNRIVKENDDVKIILNAHEPDGDNITYFANNIPEGAKLEGNIFSWKPSYDTVKKEGFVNIVMDKFGALSKTFYLQFSVSSKDKKIVQNVVINVKDVNRAPVLEDMETITINEAEALKIIPKAYDLDGDKVSLSYSGFINKDDYKSNFGDAGTYYVKVTASDGLLETSKFVQINITHVNRAPVFSPIADIKSNEGDSIVILLDAKDPNGDKLNYSIDNPAQNSSLKANAFFWTPGYGLVPKKQTKKFDFVFVASDGKAQARQIAHVEVSHKNRAPKITNASKDIVAKVNEPVLMFVKAIDEDADILTYTWDFGFFEKYKATPMHQRIFTSRGSKSVKVIVSDGTDEAEQLINVNVI